MDPEMSHDCPIHFVDGEGRILEVGTTLGDIRISSPAAYIVDHENNLREFRRSKYQLENGRKYDLVVPQGMKLYYFTFCLVTQLSSLCYPLLSCYASKVLDFAVHDFILVLFIFRLAAIIFLLVK